MTGAEFVRFRKAHRLTTATAGEFFGVSRKTVERWGDDGERIPVAVSMAVACISSGVYARGSVCAATFRVFMATR